MFNIADYALRDDVAQCVADEVSHYIAMAALACEETKALQIELQRERELTDAYRFALRVYQWTSGAGDA